MDSTEISRPSIPIVPANPVAGYADSCFRLIHRRINLVNGLPGGNVLRVIPTGDIHHNAPSHAAESFDNELRSWRREKKNTYFILTGDEVEFSSASERIILSNDKLHETTRYELDKLGERHVRRLSDRISFMRHRTLGVIQGNHYWRFSDGQTSSSMLADFLGAPWLGSVAYIVLAITLNGVRYRVDIVVAHGKAGGKLAGTTINQVDDLRTVFPAADVYIMGHDHRRGALPVSGMVVDTTRNAGQLVLRDKTQWLCRSGSFLKAYEPNTSNYVTGKLGRPLSIGTIKIDVHFIAGKERVTRRNKRRKEIHVWA